MFPTNSFGLIPGREQNTHTQRQTIQLEIPNANLFIFFFWNYFHHQLNSAPRPKLFSQHTHTHTRTYIYFFIFPLAVVGACLTIEKRIIIINIWTLKHGWNKKRGKNRTMTLIKSVVELCIRYAFAVRHAWTNGTIQCKKKKRFEMQFIILCKTILLYMLTATNSQTKRALHLNVIS